MKPRKVPIERRGGPCPRRRSSLWLRTWKGLHYEWWKCPKKIEARKRGGRGSDVKYWRVTLVNTRKDKSTYIESLRFGPEGHWGFQGHSPYDAPIFPGNIKIPRNWCAFFLFRGWRTTTRDLRMEDNAYIGRKHVWDSHYWQILLFSTFTYTFNGTNRKGKLDKLESLRHKIWRLVRSTCNMLKPFFFCWQQGQRSYRTSLIYSIFGAKVMGSI